MLAARRAVLCEKPLTRRLAEAQLLRDTVAASGLPFAVNFPFARDEAAQRLLDLVQSGQLGAIKPLRPTLRFATWPPAWQAGAQPWLAGAQPWLAGSAEGGCSRELLSHVVLLANRLFGPGQRKGVQLKPAPGQIETRLQAHLVHGAVTVWVNAAVEGELIDHQRFELLGSGNRVALTSGYGVWTTPARPARRLPVGQHAGRLHRLARRPPPGHRGPGGGSGAHGRGAAGGLNSGRTGPNRPVPNRRTGRSSLCAE